MSRSYQIPPDMKEKEKIIGGVLNINQFLWLVGGFVVGAMMFMIFWSITHLLLIAVFFTIIGGASTAPFAFYKKRDLTLYQYITRKRAFKKKSHKLINHRKGVGR